jgi:hypothetical protein
MKQPRFRPVLTPGGFAISVIAAAVLLRSLLARNPYEITLSSVMLLLLLVLGIIGWWKSRKLTALEAGWKPPFPMTANAGGETLVSGLDMNIPMFFRLHFKIRGRFFPVGNLHGCRVLAEVSVPRGEASARIPLDFPVSGVFQGSGFCHLCDVFGFYSFPCGLPQHRIVKVRSAPCFGRKLHINAHAGAEDRRNKHSTNEERYYMREYTPGDRFRDINWKSSEKIDTLITRISPDNQEKVSRIEVCFRNYGPVNKTSLEALWLLDRAKARLSHFLRSLKEQQSSYIFDVRAAGGSWEIEDEEDLDAFLEELAGFSFSPPQNDMPPSLDKAAPHGAGNIYVFSTACDTGLSGFILACNPRPVSLFLVQPVKKDSVKKTEIETLYIRDFLEMGYIPPLLRFINRRVKQMGAHAGSVETIYAETKL